MRVVTIAERRAAEVARAAEAVAVVTTELGLYARRSGVDFVVFGSFARGDFLASSDLDLMIEGSDGLLSAARDFAEVLCERNGLKHDIHFASEVSDGLMMRIRRDGRPVP